MAFSTIPDTTTNVIRLLNDKPNDVDGLSATDLKEKFDDAAQGIADFINKTLIPEMQENGADNIIIPAGQYLGEDMTLAEVLTYLEKHVNEKVTTSIPDRSITAAKIVENAITAGEIADGTITADELAADAVTTAKILDGNVTDAKIDTVSSSKVTGDIPFSQVTGDIAFSRITGSIATSRLDGTISNDQLAGDIPHGKLASDAVYKSATATLATGNTEWVVANTDVTASNHIIVSPADDTSWSEWVNKGVRLSSQVEGNLIFHARSTTTAQITVNILIIL